jgi:hypothetical protein
MRLGRRSASAVGLVAMATTGAMIGALVMAAGATGAAPVPRDSRAPAELLSTGRALVMSGPDDGWYIADRASGEVLRHWDGVRWSVGFRLPAGAYVISADEIAPDDVWAVGQREVSGGQETYAVHWDGSSWTESRLPSEPSGSFLLRVSALSADSVYVTGTTIQGESANPITLVWNGTAWTRARGVLARLQFFDAHSATDAWGSGVPVRTTGPMIIAHWNGRSWRQVALGGIQGTDLVEDVSAIAANDVWASGKDGFQRAFTAHWDGSTWTRVPNALPTGDLSTLASVSGDAADDVWAGGIDFTTGASVMEHWDGTAWSIIAQPGGDGTDGLVSGVKALSPSDAWAAGQVTPASGVTHRILEHWNGSRWVGYRGSR